MLVVCVSIMIIKVLTTYIVEIGHHNSNWLLNTIHYDYLREACVMVMFRGIVRVGITYAA